jgi:uncharacterized UBP type Zn finger protein
MSDRCEHFGDAIDVPPRTKGCEGCLALGETWTALRVCQSCGHVGCCEDSKHAHALRHFRTTGHPLIMSFDRNERWAWCYVHNRYFQDVRVPAGSALGGLRSLFRRLAGR